MFARAKFKVLVVTTFVLGAGFSGLWALPLEVAPDLETYSRQLCDSVDPGQEDHFE